MFLIHLNYKKPIEDVDKYLVEHRHFLDGCYEKNYFIVSGPKNPRTGGIIISQLKSREQLEAILRDDPFYIHQIADYELIEFTPVKYHKNFISFLES